MADNSKKNEANIQFNKAQRAEDGKKAMSEYESAAAATRVKTERLRALRLARDAAEGAAPAKPAAAPKKKAAAKKVKKPAGSLSDWLEGQKKGGHRT